MTSEQPPAEQSSADSGNPAYSGSPWQPPAMPPDAAGGPAPDPYAAQRPSDPMDPAYGLGAPYPAYPQYPGYPYPPNAGYAPSAGYPPAGAPAQPSGGYPQPSGGYGAPQPGTQPSGAYPWPQPGEPAPNSMAPGAPYPPYAQYPGYPPQDAYSPQGAYPPNSTYPGAPYPQYAYPAAPSYPLYSPYTSAPYGAPAPGTYPSTPQAPGQFPPTPPMRRRRLLLPAILGGIAAVVIIAVVAVGLLALSRQGNATTSANATPTLTPFPTATSLPTATAFPGGAAFSDAIPGVCGDHPNQWSTDTTGATVACAHGAMTLTHPVTDKYVGEEFFQPQNYTFPSQYQVSVTVANITDGCGGVLALGNNFLAYSLYLCADGEWKLVTYDTNGHPQTLDSNFLGATGTHSLTLAFTPGRLDASVDGINVTTTRPPYNTTYYLGLECDDTSQYNVGSVDFSKFVVTA